MNLELVFSIAGLIAAAGWFGLIFSPLMPRWSDRFATYIAPVILSIGYLFYAGQPTEGGFSTFADVTHLFSHRSAIMSGWIHFLAFDLLIGAWICRAGRQKGIPFWAILPCMPLTFLYGPAGFLLFVVVYILSKIVQTRSVVTPPNP